MPELPEVETTRRGIAPHIEGKSVVSVILRHSQLRWPIPCDLHTVLHERTLHRVHRRAKYLLLEFTHGHLIIHLGMSGSLRIVTPETRIQKHDHVDLLFDENTCLRYHDPRRFGAILWTVNTPEQHVLLNKLGPEPLDDIFNGEYLLTLGQKRKKNIKSFIMDNHIVVGVGNIYANEALFKTGIRPTRLVSDISLKEYKALSKNIKQILAGAIAQGGTTLRDFVGGDGKPGYFAQQLFVYGRSGEDCKVCGTTLEEIRQQQRISVFCPQCQQ